MSTPASVNLVCEVFEDTYGRVGAKILRLLLDEGQLTLVEIAKRTQSPATAVQRTLVSMVTNRFASFWQQGPKTLYSGNWKQVYQILWSGQLLAQNESQDGWVDAMKECIIRGLVKASPENQHLIKNRSLVPVKEWQFWPEIELAQSLQTKKAREVANNPDSMGKSESAQKVQVATEIQAELSRIRDQTFVNSDPRSSDPANSSYTINWDKFSIQSRRLEFTQYVARQIGEATSKVYEILSRLSDYRIVSVDERRIPSLDSCVTTQQIVGQLDEKLVQELAMAFENAAQGTNDSKNGDKAGGKRSKTNTGKSVNVRSMKPAELVNKHLDLLMESRSADFVQRSGTRAGGEWFVPYEKVNSQLKQQVFDEIVAQSLGEPASRSIGLIRQRGKLDEKMLGNFALLPASEIRHQMSALSYFGFTDIQESAPPNQRSGGAAVAQKRSSFLWYHRPEWAYSRSSDQLYIQLSDLIKQSQALRRNHDILLTKLCRDDVKSDIEQFLTAKEREELEQFQQEERDIFKRMNMLDRHVRIFREY